MKNKTGKGRVDLSLTMVVSFIIGILLLVWPMQTSFSVIKLVGILLLVSGIFSLVTYLAAPIGAMRLTGGVVILVIGIIFVFMPGSVIWLISALIGIVLLIHGIRDFKVAKALAADKVLSMIIAIVTIILGILLIINAFGVWSFGLRLIGLAILLDALGDLFLGIKSKGFRSQGPIDVEYREL